jgi:hypothetical protein
VRTLAFVFGLCISAVGAVGIFVPATSCGSPSTTLSEESHEVLNSYKAIVSFEQHLCRSNQTAGGAPR